MLTKTINVSGTLITNEGLYLNISFNYRNNPSEIVNLDFNFNKDEVNVFGTYNIPNKKLANYSVNNGYVEPKVLEDIIATLEFVAQNPENPDLYMQQ